MGAWVRGSRDGLTYRGRITRARFAAWTASAEGAAAIGDVASRIRFSLFGRMRAARRTLWREIEAAARDEAAVAAIQTETRAYLQRLGGLAYADGLPRTTVQLHRLVVIPCVLANGDAYTGFERRLSVQSAFASLEGGKALRDFFILTLVHEICAAVETLEPSPKRPLPGAGPWITIGMNATFPWRMPILNEPHWNGHYYVLELTRESRDGLARGLRKAVAAEITRFERELPTLSRSERAEILRRARYAA
jgi:hypothetical protein